MAMRLLAGGGKSFGRAAVRASSPAFLAAPIRPAELPLLAKSPSMGASIRAAETSVFTRAPAMGAPVRAAETTVLPRAQAMGPPLRAGLNSNVGFSFAANAAGSARVAASRVLTPPAAAPVWRDRSGLKTPFATPFASRCLSSATKPPPTDSGIWNYLLVAYAIGGAAVFYFLTKFEHVDDLHEGELPESIDWSSALNFPSVAHPIYNTNCGSCWAVTGVKSIEAYFAIKEGVLFRNLSIQQMIDCAAINGCAGCSLNRAYAYAAATGLTTEEAYPGPAHPGHPGRGRSFLQGLLKSYCNMQGKPVVARIRGHERIQPTEESLMRALQSGPVAVRITTSDAFDKYPGGILQLHQCPSSARPNHDVLVVGYGTTKEGVKYWKIMNTWGPRWGERGYGRLERVGAGYGVCGITRFSGYRPVVA